MGIIIGYILNGILVFALIIIGIRILIIYSNNNELINDWFSSNNFDDKMPILSEKERGVIIHLKKIFSLFFMIFFILFLGIIILTVS